MYICIDLFGYLICIQIYNMYIFNITYTYILYIYTYGIMYIYILGHAGFLSSTVLGFLCLPTCWSSAAPLKDSYKVDIALNPPRAYYLGTGALEGLLRAHYLGTWGAKVGAI